MGRACRPCLRRTGFGVTYRTSMLLTGKAAVQFRQACVFKIVACITESLEQLCYLRFRAVLRKAQSDQRCVMRPDRAIVIAQWIVAPGMRREGANSPTTEHILAHQSCNHVVCVLFGDDARPEALSGVGGHDIARASGAIEGHVEGLLLRPPVTAEEIFLEGVCRPVPLCRNGRMLHDLGQRAHSAIGCKGVGLYLAESQRGRSELTIPVGGRVV